MDPLLSTALAAAEAATQVHLRHFGELVVGEAREKAKSDFVTRVDIEAQEVALDVIRERHPDHQILAEEEGVVGRDDASRGGGGIRADAPLPVERAPFLWIVDPLDGTTNYLHRHPCFAASVGVVRVHSEGMDFEAGAVVAGRTGERWWARRGSGAWKNGRTLRVSRLRSLKTALVGTGFPFKEPELVPRYLEEFHRVLPNSGGVRRCGSAALDLCYLAEGILDAFWEEEYLSPWDVAAGVAILEEAGGVATRIDGSPFDLKPGSVLAANSPRLLQELGVLVRGE